MKKVLMIGDDNTGILALGHRLALASGIAVSEALPKFGDIKEPEIESKIEIKGTHKLKDVERIGESLPKRKTKLHRRQYLCGKGW